MQSKVNLFTIFSLMCSNFVIIVAVTLHSLPKIISCSIIRGVAVKCILVGNWGCLLKKFRNASFDLVWIALTIKFY